jgi:hypothetical protein
MLAKSPQDRYRSAGQVAEALASQRGGKSAGSTLKVQRGSETSRGLLAPAAPKRRRPKAYLACGLILAGAAVLVVALGTGSRTPPVPKAEAVAAGPSPVVPAAEHKPLVTLASVSSGKRYDLVTARIGETYWIDRPYKITALSPGLDGVTLVRGANDDKNVVNAAHLTLTLGQPATVYVAYDKRGTKLPAWLEDGTWQLTAESLSASGGDAQASPWRVHAKRFAAGSVILGGNKQPPAAGAGSNYVVMVKP